jgi:hypothetical protein
MTVTARQAYTHGDNVVGLQVTVRGEDIPVPGSMFPVKAFTRVSGKTVSGELYSAISDNQGFAYTFFPGGRNEGLLLAKRAA